MADYTQMAKTAIPQRLQLFINYTKTLSRLQGGFHLGRKLAPKLKPKTGGSHT